MEFTAVTPQEFAELDGLDEWRYVLGSVHAVFQAGSFRAAAALVVSIAEAAEAVRHHPDIDVRYPDRVRVSLTTHEAGRITTLDVQVAREISALAARAGATSEPTFPQSLEVAIDTMDADRIRPFWAAVLGYRVLGDGSIADPLHVGPSFWFQQMDAPRTERNRFHIDVSVPHDVAADRIAAALAAGGTLLTDRFARAFWVLADADGNEACICTWQDRT